MSQFEILECEETERTKSYALKVKISRDGETQVVDCVVRESLNANSSMARWTILPSGLEGRAVWDALNQKALAKEIFAAVEPKV